MPDVSGAIFKLLPKKLFLEKEWKCNSILEWIPMKVPMQMSPVSMLTNLLTAFRKETAVHPRTLKQEFLKCNCNP